MVSICATDSENPQYDLWSPELLTAVDKLWEIHMSSHFRNDEEWGRAYLAGWGKYASETAKIITVHTAKISVDPNMSPLKRKVASQMGEKAKALLAFDASNQLPTAIITKTFIEDLNAIWSGVDDGLTHVLSSSLLLTINLIVQIFSYARCMRGRFLLL